MNICCKIKRYQRVCMEGRQMQNRSISPLFKGNGNAVGLKCYRFDRVIGSNADLHTVECWKIGKKADVAAINGRRIKHVERKDIFVLALAQTDSAA